MRSHKWCNNTLLIVTKLWIFSGNNLSYKSSILSTSKFCDRFVNHQQQSKEGEELAQLSITSADYNKLSEEVERLQKQLAGMDDSRMETKSLNKAFVFVSKSTQMSDKKPSQL